MTQASQIFKGKVIGVIREGRLKKNGCRYLQFLADDKTVVSVIGTDVQYFLASDCVGLRFEAGGKKKGEGNFTATWLVVWGVDPFPSYLRMRKYGSIEEYNRLYRMQQKRSYIMSATAKQSMAELAISKADSARGARLEREARTRAFLDKLVDGCQRKQSPILTAAYEATVAFEEVVKERDKLQKMLDELCDKF